MTQLSRSRALTLWGTDEEAKTRSAEEKSESDKKSKSPDEKEKTRRHSHSSSIGEQNGFILQESVRLPLQLQKFLPLEALPRSPAYRCNRGEQSANRASSAKRTGVTQSLGRRRVNRDFVILSFIYPSKPSKARFASPRISRSIRSARARCFCELFPRG